MKEKLYELLGAIYGGDKNAIEDVIKMFNQLYNSISNARELIDNILEEGLEMAGE